MRPNHLCLDCREATEACDTCAFVAVRNKWRLFHGTEPPSRLWSAAIRFGGRHVYLQLRRQGWRADSTVVRRPWHWQKHKKKKKLK